MKKIRFLTILLSLTLALSVLFSLNASAATYALGDVNGDGKVTSADARIALRCAAKLERLSEARTKAADVDRSDKVNSTDARIILRVAAKTETLEVGENDIFEEPDVLRELSCIGDDVNPLGIYELRGGRVAVYCTTQINGGDPDVPDENGAYGAPRVTPDEADDPLLPEGKGDFIALDEDGRGPDEEDEPVQTVGEGDFSALDEDGRGPDEISEEPEDTADGDDTGYGSGEELIYIVDIEKDELIDTYVLPAEQTLFCVRKNGQFVTMYWTPECMTISMLNEKMETVSSFEMPSVELYVDRENDCFYVFDDNGKTLERWNYEGVSETIFTPPHGMSVTGFDAGSGVAAVTDDSATFGVTTDLFLYDIKTEKPFYQRPSYAFYYEFTNGVFLSTCNIFQNSGNDAYVTALHTIPISEPDSERLLRLPTDAYLECYDGTSAALTTVSRYDPENDIVYPSVFYLTDVEAGRITLPLSGLDEISYLTSCYDADTGKIVATGCSEGEDAASLKLFTLDPAAAQYVDELEAIDPPTYSEPSRTLPAGWEGLRQKADAMERDFDLTVLIGDQVLDYQDGSGYNFVSLEDPEYFTEDITPVEETDALLDMLRRGLEEYPENFFSQFKNSRGQGGLRIMLVRDLLNPEGDFLAGGVAYKTGAWYNVAIAVGNMNDTNTVHHELWHAAESRIDKEDFRIFSYESWSALNPDGFDYSDDLDHYYENEELFDYIIPWDYDASKYGDVWFAEMYSTVTACEDRATLIETLTSEFYDPAATGYADPRDWIAQMPHLKAKLDYMAEQSERVFGCGYWETIRERVPKG